MGKMDSESESWWRNRVEGSHGQVSAMGLTALQYHGGVVPSCLPLTDFQESMAHYSFAPPKNLYSQHQTLSVRVDDQATWNLEYHRETGQTNTGRDRAESQSFPPFDQGIFSL